MLVDELRQISKACAVKKWIRESLKTSAKESKNYCIFNDYELDGEDTTALIDEGLAVTSLKDCGTIVSWGVTDIPEVEETREEGV